MTPTVETKTPEPTRTSESVQTPKPTPTSVAAQFFITPTPRPTSVPPTPLPPLTGRIVYQTSTGGDINVVNVNGTGQRTVAQGLDPAWSPDGKQIAFIRWDDPNGLFVVNADGSGLRRLLEVTDAKSPAWSADGSKIVFTTRDWRVAPASKGQPAGQKAVWQLGAIRVADGSPVDIPVDGEFYAFSPTWSPQGFIGYKGTRGLYVTSEGGQAVIISSTGRPDSPVWSPDGNRLALMLWQHDHWDIFAMNPDGSYVNILTRPAPVQKRIPNNVAPAWSPDGKYIIFLSDREGEGNWRVYVMNADGANQRKLLDVPIVYDYASERVLSWTK